MKPPPGGGLRQREADRRGMCGARCGSSEARNTPRLAPRAPACIQHHRAHHTPCAAQGAGRDSGVGACDEDVDVVRERKGLTCVHVEGRHVLQRECLEALRERHELD